MMGITRVVALAAVFVLTAVSSGAAAPQASSRLSDQQLKDLSSRIQTRTDTFRGSLERAIDRHSINGTQAEDRVNQSVKDFEQAGDRLRDRVDNRRSSTADVEDVLTRASIVDRFMTDNRLESAAQRDWQDLRRDLDGLARAHGLAWNWADAGHGASRTSDQQVKQLLARLKKESDQFRKSLDKALDGSRLDGSREETSINQSATDFAKATNRVRVRFDSRQIVTRDIEDVLRRAGGIDRFMVTEQGRLAIAAENDWLTVRRDLDELARAYNLGSSWSEHGYTPGEPDTRFSRALTGTYQLESGRGDDPWPGTWHAGSARPGGRGGNTGG